ncbi:MAG: HAD-IA family hydrolase [Egibacteraceae bacterium]
MGGSAGVRLRARALLFDLDGVLVDSSAAVDEVWTRYAERHGLDPEAVLPHVHGRPAAETIRALTPQADLAEESRLLEDAEVALAEAAEALPGAARVLGALAPGSWTVATSGTRRLATTRLRAAGLPVPDGLVAADDVARGKPDPEPYALAAARLGVAPGEAVVVEDTPAGIAAGVAAGAAVLAVATTFPPEALSAARATLASLAGLEVAVDADGAILLQA